MARKRAKRIYRYKCTLTEKEYKVTSEAPRPDELVSVEAYYQMNPEEDDRPESVLAQLGIDRDAPLEPVSSDDDTDEDTTE